MAERHRTGAVARRQLEGEYDGAVADDDDRTDLEAPLRSTRPGTAPARSAPVADLIGGPAHWALVADLYADTRG